MSGPLPAIVYLHGFRSSPASIKATRLQAAVDALPADARPVLHVPFLRDGPAACIAQVTAVLDTLPYSGGDTTGAALAAGLPVVTRMGERHAERVTASILMHAGLRELVAHGDDAFVTLAVRLATDAVWRAAVAQRVRSAFSDPRLTDPARYAASLERAFLHALAEPPRAST